MPIKNRQIQRKFPRVKVIAYENNEIWSIDVTYVNKLAKYNNGVKYLLVAVDVLSKFLRVVPMRSKSAPDAAKAIEKMIEKVQPQKVWSDKGTEFKGAFKNLCDQRGIATYTTASKTKSAFAERKSRSLKKIMYKHMENKWTYHYISKLSQFVSTIKSHRQYGIKRRGQRKVIVKVLQFNHFTNIRGCLFYSDNTIFHSCNC